MALALTPLNGLLPAHMLRVVDGGRGPRGPQRLRHDAADAYDRCLRAGMPSGCLRSGYRDRTEQQAEVDRAKAGRTPVAAAPGRSYHGEGTAADVDEPARSWLRAWGAPYGWRGGLIASEQWHFVYDPDYDQHRDTPAAPVPEEDDMPYSPDDLTRIIREATAGLDARISALTTEVSHIKTKVSRQDPQLIHFQLADGRWCVAVPRAQTWMAAPDDTAWRKHRDILHAMGLLGTLAVQTHSQVTGAPTDVVQDPRAYGRQVAWARLD